MKPLLPFSFLFFCKPLSRVFAFLFLISFSFQVKSSAQCAAGYTSATLDWDNLDYFHRNGGVYGGTNPVTALPFVTATMAQIQYFAFGTNKLTINTTIPVGTFSSQYGEVTEHTGETGAYGTGADIKYVKATIQYFDEFYQTINNPVALQKEFGYPCNKNGTGNVVIKGLKNE